MNSGEFSQKDCQNAEYERQTRTLLTDKRTRTVMISLCALMLLGFIIGSLIFSFFGREDEAAIYSSLSAYINSSAFVSSHSLGTAAFNFLCRVFFDEKFLLVAFLGAYTIYASVIGYALVLYKGALLGFSATVFAYALRTPSEDLLHPAASYAVFLISASLLCAVFILFCTKAICFSYRMRLCDKRPCMFVQGKESITFFCEFLLFSMALMTVVLSEAIGFALISLV